MGQRGPRPLPSNVKEFTGSSRRPLRAADLSDGVHPEVGLPPMPKHLSREAKAEWRRISPLLLELNLLTKIDRSALERYCRLYGRWQQVERALTAAQEKALEEDGDASDALWKLMPSGIARESILARMARELAHRVEQAEACFGMNPSARARVVASRNDAQYRLPGFDGADEQPEGMAQL